MGDERYPDEPGSTDDNTSRRAAEEIKPRATSIRSGVLRVCKAKWPGGGVTPDEGAAILKVDFMSVRPRFTELYKQGLIEKTKETRRTSRSGKLQAVYRWKPSPAPGDQQALF